jgi:hypothetical protein
LRSAKRVAGLRDRARSASAVESIVPRHEALAKLLMKLSIAVSMRVEVVVEKGFAASKEFRPPPHHAGMKEVRGEPSRGHDEHRPRKERHLTEWHDKRCCRWAVNGGEGMGGWHRREGALQPRTAGSPTTTMGTAAADKTACTGDRGDETPTIRGDVVRRPRNLITIWRIAYNRLSVAFSTNKKNISASQDRQRSTDRSKGIHRGEKRDFHDERRYREDSLCASLHSWGISCLISAETSAVDNSGHAR